jgi:hypothetical protein
MSRTKHPTGQGGRRDRKAIPAPPDPLQRAEPLPWEQPKPEEADPEARRQIEAILKSPSYRSAAEDSEFLGGGEARGPRLEIDYLKPELILREHEIDAAIVVFGSTRIPEPAAAARRLQALKTRAADAPDDADLDRRIRVAERVLDKSRYYTWHAISAGWSERLDGIIRRAGWSS